MSTHVCRLAELRDNAPTVLRTDHGDIVVIRQGDEVFALEDVCSHAEVPLSEGDIADGSIECWLHGSRFDLRTGEPSGPPAFAPVVTYPTTIGQDPAGQPVVTIDLTAPSIP